LFEEFLTTLGEFVTLNGFSGFRGGLDVRGDSTGTKSVFTTFLGLNMMFHVATLLPHSLRDMQQVEKKRHLGNDIVVIIFNESSKPFSPQSVTSEFNHVYAVVRPLMEKSATGNTRYQVAFASKQGVPPFGPLLSEPSIFERGPSFREFFLTKIVNAEQAACEAPVFATKIRRTRGILLHGILENYLNKKNF